MAIDTTSQMFYLTEIMKEMLKSLDKETLDMVHDMDSDPSELKDRLNNAITPEIADKLKAIELPPKLDSEQVSGFQVEAYIEGSLNSDDPAIAMAAEELRAAESKFMDPAQNRDLDIPSSSGPSNG